MGKRITIYEARDIFREDQRLFEEKITELKSKIKSNSNEKKRYGKPLQRSLNH